MKGYEQFRTRERRENKLKKVQDLKKKQTTRELYHHQLLIRIGRKKKTQNQNNFFFINRLLNVKHKYVKDGRIMINKLHKT